MKVTIDFGAELQPYLQHSLDTGEPVQLTIRGAMRYYTIMLEAEKTGSTCGYGDKNRFKSYNTEISPKAFQRGPKEDA